ncbi:hypothetical protein [Roseateles amylovorans]|jgi:hypothetical protein|uniref:Uncharacterized protein n=1 Tax=Roseateles amylovorans TaxID=2978473 RepID=A0ABY6B508_9BURK|nr:hypothetical protein [Roseateles amylovorans]UXH79387.1 hypothetical protein N4261_05510 [Roseateles amylovorans]
MRTRNSLETLRLSLQASVDALYRRRACDIDETYIDDYVQLDWLEWNGGGLRLTTVGENICLQEMTKLRERADTAKA